MAMTRRERLVWPALGRLLVVLAVGWTVGSCVDQRHDELYEQSEELRTVANNITAALTIEGATRVSGWIPPAHEDGPRLESVFSPVTVVADGDTGSVTLRLVHPVATAEDVTHVFLQVTNADDHIRCPVTLDAETGKASLVLGFQDASALIGEKIVLFLAFADDQVRRGNAIVAGLRMIEPKKAGWLSQEQPKFHTLADHLGATRALDMVMVNGQKRMASGGNDNEIALWDLDTGHELRRFKGHTDWVLSVDLSSDGSRIVSGGRDNTVRVWDTENGDLLTTWGNHLGQVTSVALSTDDALLASGSWDHTVHMRNTEDGKLLETFDVGDRVNSIAFSNDGKHFGLGAGRLLHAGRVMVWSTADWSLVLDVPTIEREVTSIAFTAKAFEGVPGSFNPRLLAVASGRGVITIWRYETGELVGTMGSAAPDNDHALTPPRDTIPSLDFWPGNNNVLAAVSLTGVIALWNVHDAKMVAGTATTTALTTVRFASVDFQLMMGGSVGLTHLMRVKTLAPTE